VIDSPEVQCLRAEIAGRWSAHLTRQDAQGFRPHVTIQNKTAAATAKELFEKLSTSFMPFEVLATGLLLWRYRGGPWEAAGEYGLTGRPSV
jgi:2'-5' RNA ligase